MIADLCNPSPYVYLAAVPLIVALVRRRGWLAVAIFAILLGANETTQLLKPLLRATRPALRARASGNLGRASGRAAMPPPRCPWRSAVCSLRRPGWRPWVAAAGSLFAVAVCYSFLSLHGTTRATCSGVTWWPGPGRYWRSRRC